MRIPGLQLDVQDASVPWRTTRHRGVSWLPLHLGTEPTAAEAGPREAAVLIRMDPGCGYPPHRHVGEEHVLILQGGYRDALGTHQAGEYLRYEAGSSHAPVALAAPHPACILFAVASSGVEILEGLP